MVKALELAFSKAAALPDAAQEQLGRELLDRLDALARLRAEVEIGILQLDAGEGRPLDIEDVIKQAREEHARKSK
jgi:Arc/MetJ-type ribon-helix-helix transcriptional regulator